MVPHAKLKNKSERDVLFDKIIELPNARKTIGGFYKFPGIDSDCIEISKHLDVLIKIEAAQRFRMGNPFFIFIIWRTNDRLQSECEPIVNLVIDIARKNKMDVELIYLDWRPRFIKIGLITIAAMFTATALLVMVLGLWKYL